MPAYVALLRAVNVGGTGKIEMPALRALCTNLGFENVRTYIASGNVVFESHADETTIKASLESALEAHAGKPVGVMVRTGAEMAGVLAANPFPSAAPNRAVAIFLDGPPPADLMAGVSRRANEEIAPGRREIYVWYPNGMADTKLVIKAASAGTARNMNTVAKLAEWASA
jgi:uncharacterized protein (DUF1697 family)